MRAFLTRWYLPAIQLLAVVAVAIYSWKHDELAPGFWAGAGGVVFWICVLLAAFIPFYAAIRSRNEIRSLNLYRTLFSGLSDSIRALDVKKGMEPSQLAALQKKVLTEICKAIAQHNHESDLTQYNANVMRRYDMDEYLRDNPWESVYFIHGSPDSYAGVLSISAWAEAPTGYIEKFALPIASDRRAVLCGAPKACEESCYDIIHDTKNWREMGQLLENQSVTTRNHIVAYFAAHDFSSVLCRGLERNGRRLGVLNVQSEHPFIAGKSQEEIEELKTCIEPLVRLLAMYLEEEIEAERGCGVVRL